MPIISSAAAHQAWLAEIEKSFADPTLRRIAPNHIMGHGAPNSELRRLHNAYKAALEVEREMK